MRIEELGPDALWRCYQRGYHNLIRSGVYFRQILRPGLSHAYFQRAIPLLQEYAAANRQELEMPPGFRERLDACPLSARDLLHLDYAICLGYVELESANGLSSCPGPVFQWPGPGALGGAFMAADALIMSGLELFASDGADEPDDDTDVDDPDGSESSPPFDL